MFESLAKNVGFTFIATIAITYACFQKKLLSKPVSKIVSKLFFIPTFPITLMMRIGNYWNIVDNTVLLGCAPIGFLKIPESLHKLGVRGVVNMQTEFEGPTNYYSELGIKQLRLPTVDHYEPSVENMKEAVKFIKEYQLRGEKVYIHCKAGHGRAASIALCWMMAENPTISPKDVNAMLSSKRKVRTTLYKQPNIQAFHASLQSK